MTGEVNFTSEDEDSCMNYNFKSTSQNNKVCLWVPYNGSNDYCINYDYSSTSSSDDSGLGGVAILGQDRVRIRVSPERMRKEEIEERRESIATLYEEIDDVEGYFEESSSFREAMPPPLPPRLFKSKSMHNVVSKMKRKNLFQHLGLSQKNEDDAVVSAKKIALDNMRRNVSGEFSRKKDLTKYLGFEDNKIAGLKVGNKLEGVCKTKRRHTFSKALKEGTLFGQKTKKVESESLHDESFEELLSFIETQESRSSNDKKKNLQKLLGFSETELNVCETELDLRNTPNYEELKYLNNNYMPKPRASSFSSTSTVSSSSSLSSTELSISVSDAVSTLQSPSSRTSSFSKLIRKSRRFSMSGLELMGSIRRKSSLSGKPSLQSLDDKTNEDLTEENSETQDIDFGIEESLQRNMPVIPFGKPTWVIVEEDLRNQAKNTSTNTEKNDVIEREVDEPYQTKDSLDYLINLAKNEMVKDRSKSPTEVDEPIYMEMSHQYHQQNQQPNFQEYMDMNNVQQIFLSQLQI